MKIIHCCLSCFYIDGFSYQENELVSQNVADGHEVLVVASTETYDSKGSLVYVEPKDYLGFDGARVVRLQYSKYLPGFLGKKIRKFPGFLKILEDYRPDVILFHGICGFELFTAARYKNKNPNVRLYADSHEDYNNSATNILSKYILHIGFYRAILRLSASSIDKILCVSLETIEFANQIYGLPNSILEFYPLGGLILGDDQYEELRASSRRNLQIRSDEIVFIQTGKIDKKKKLIEALKAFQKLDSPNAKYIVAGNLHNDISAEVQSILKADQRVQYLGWQSPENLRAMLCAADVYVQPGTQSATMQMSLCCRCAVVLDDVPSHKPYINGNGWLIGSENTIEQIFRCVMTRKDVIYEMGNKSAEIAGEILDYRKLSARLYV